MDLLIISILPIIFILIFVYRKDHINKEPFSKLLVTFCVGCFSVIPAAIMEMKLSFFAPKGLIMAAAFEGYVVAGFSEELCKLILLMLIVWRSRHFDEYFDGIVYAVFLSMGFACVENITYVFGNDTWLGAISTGTLRAFLSVPGHFLFAVAMGYYVALAKFDPKHRKKHLFHALLYPVILHGTFDAIIMISDAFTHQGTTLYTIVNLSLPIIFIYFDIKLWQQGIKRIEHLQEMSQQQEFDRQNPFYNFKW
ncbi:MAG: PrsW family intramembrane metalloprotease [Bacteroidales bacterium]|nr:PrsW family intramembrane metalloprotease [Candidatus Colimorpha onthohippi]